MTDLDKLRKGEKALIESIYNECYPGILSWIKNNSGSAPEAEDVFQEAMVATYNKAKDPTFNLSCKITTFVFSVAKKLWLNQLRARGRVVHTTMEEIENLESSDEITLNQTVVLSQRETLFQQYFDRLSVECRRILTLFLKGSTMTQIASILGLESESNARKRKFRCKEELLSKIQSDPQYSTLKVSF